MSRYCKHGIDPIHCAHADCNPPKGDSRSASCSEERLPREVIEDQLLAALDDKEKVAILATEDDLLRLMAALQRYKPAHPETDEWRIQYLKDLKQLSKAAFPLNKEDRAPS